MKKLVPFIMLLVFFCSNASGQNSLWTITTESKMSKLKKFERATLPSKFLLYKLNFGAFKTLVATAPLDSSGQISNVQVTFPNPNGTLERYIVYEAPVMEAGLATKYPAIKSYIAKGISDATATIRFSITNFGLHAILTSGNSGTFYIDSYTKDTLNYIIYSKKNIVKSKSFSCLVEDQLNVAASGALKTKSTLSNDGLFRQYRLAMACTIEYADFHVNAAGLNSGTLEQKKGAVLSAMVVSMTRINGLYEKDISVRMNLVANNDALIFIDSDNFSNDDADLLIDESQTIIDDIIGNANYDIGHTVSTGGGGLAGLGVICITGQKGSGITGSYSPVGDPYDIDYVAHELGHQFGANHTYNNACGGNINPSTAVEPGSGSTIMAYAGICDPNVQDNSDAYFHAISIAEMLEIVYGTTCAATTSNGNFAPVVNAGPNYLIPKGTPFILKATATDANNDALTYCWEQIDVESSVQPPEPTAIAGPNFRSINPSSSPERYFPSIQDVISNNLAPTWEVIPTVARTFNFALTVRDNRSPNGGQTNRDDTVITVANVGPFLVSTPNTAVSWVAGTNQNVTWDVAGTNSNGINASNVDVLLSTDGGFTYPILLASKVPNDGLETITVPNNLGTTNRVMVRGYNNVFYDISNTNFTITAAPSSFAVAFSGVAESQSKLLCTGNSIDFTINYTALSGFSDTTTFTATGAPSVATVTFSPTAASSTGTVTMTLGNLASASGNFQIVVTATAGSVARTATFYLAIGVSPAVLATPVNYATEIGLNPTLSWNPSSEATSYDVQVATNATFTTIISSGNVTTSSYSTTGLSAETTYYWRVLPKNAICNGVFTNAFQFITGVIACVETLTADNLAMTISAAGTPTITATITIPTGGTITDVNAFIRIPHTYVGDLKVTLTSPAGTTITLFDEVCDDKNNVFATFDDAGAPLVCASAPTIQGTVKPLMPLAAFNNEIAAGVWTLTISDLYDGDGGNLRRWGLTICTIQPVVRWTGATSNDWATASNWSNNLVPNGSYSIEIPVGRPVLSTSYTVQPNNYVKITGTGALTISPAASLITQGTVDFGNLPVLIQSNSTGTATIGQVTGALVNATNVSVSRFIPARRAWRALTTPLRGNNTSLFSTWQNNGVVIAGTGVEVWGPSGTGIATGPNYSVLDYTSSGWVGVSNTQTANLFSASRNNAYLVFVTGPYGSANIANRQSAVATLRATGSLIVGDVPYTGIINSRHTLIGNPYASPLTPNQILTGSVNLLPFYWVWDPSVGVTGGYVAYDNVLQTYSNNTGSYPTNTRAVQSGQAFFVRATAGNVGSFTLTESKKSSTVANVFGKESQLNNTNAVNASILRLGLLKSDNQDWLPLDGAVAGFYDTANPAVDNNDGLKFANSAENIAFVRSNTVLSSEHFSIPQASDELFIRIWNTSINTYKLLINTEGFSVTDRQATLFDLFTGIQTPLLLNGNIQEYPFNVNANIASTGDRFKIVFNSTTLSHTNFNTSAVQVYPNPATKGMVNVILPAGDYSSYRYELINLLGQKVLSNNIDTASNHFIIQTTGLTNSWYALRILNKGVVVYQTKIIIAK